MAPEQSEQQAPRDKAVLHALAIGNRGSQDRRTSSVHGTSDSRVTCSISTYLWLFSANLHGFRLCSELGMYLTCVIRVSAAAAFMLLVC